MREFIGFILLLPGLGLCGMTAEIASDVEPLRETKNEGPEYRNAFGNDQLLLLQTLATVNTGDNHQLNRILQRCETCHSYPMVSGNRYLPVLQGQNIEYLFTKLVMFKNNTASRHPFPGESKNLTLEQIARISRYYSGLPGGLNLQMLLKAGDSLEADNISAQLAENDFRSCLNCHGRNGNGDRTIPALSGQNFNYLAYRIRQISSEGSSIHVDSSNPLDCRISPLSIRQSRLFAGRFALVVDPVKSKSGRDIYDRKCASCHDAGKSYAPPFTNHSFWEESLQQGTRALIQSAMQNTGIYHSRLNDDDLEPGQFVDAVHFMLIELLRF